MCHIFIEEYWIVLIPKLMYRFYLELILKIKHSEVYLKE